ncbi:papilin isoform X2 [Zootermopsis nevadensis]|uniref:papilin isoform X2 n=1 Tax=Zootermopsis nevadensis TaxID=136037 RepID=UPI000B8EA29B|nr:papilin isoform X2 [Zootermopsis nevadensis]
MQCTDVLGPKPPSTQTCNIDVPCPTWHVGPWKPCNRLCGEGAQKRRVRCFRRVEGKIEVLGDSACPGEKPEDEKPCELRPCEGVDWIVSDWSGCEDKCGLTQETRRVHCANQMGKIYPDDHCHSYRLPELARECESPVPCDHEWFASQWSECSAYCGSGVKTRKVFCGKYDGDTIKKVDDEKCDLRKKYEGEGNCTGKEECEGQWYAGPWTACSKPCGGGVMSRKVLCFIENNTVDANNCDPSLIHFSSETCNNHPCSEDQIMPMEPAHVEEEEEEECAEETDGTVITMETTLELDKSGVTPVSGATEFEGSGELDVFSSEVMPSDITSDTASSHVTLEATPLTSSRDFSPVSTEFGSSVGALESFATSPSSIGETNSLFTGSSFDAASVSRDVMLGDSADVSPENESSVFTASDSSDVTASSGIYSSADSSALSSSSSFSSSPNLDAATTTSLELSGPTDIQSSSELSVGSEASKSTDALLETSAYDLTSSDKITDPTDSTSEATSNSIYSISTSSDITLETGSGDEGSGLTIGIDIDTDITSVLTGSGMGITDFTHPDIGGEVDPYAIEVNSSEDIIYTSVSPDDIKYTSVSPDDIKYTSVSPDLLPTTESGPTESTSESSFSTTGSSMVSSTKAIESSVFTTEVSVSSFGAISEISEETISTPTSLSSAEEGYTRSTSETISEGYTSTTEGAPIISTTEVTTTEEYTLSEVLGETTSESREVIEETTPSPIELAITKEQKMKKCKRKKKPKPELIKCEDTKFGCCPDGSTLAEGPFSKGCPQPATCEETEFGCCPDAVSPAKGKKKEGCPPSHCEETLFGCCPDGIGIAEGNDNEGCEELPVDCKDTEFGCCLDGITAAVGANNTGCFECEGSGDCDTCNATKYGCCPDGMRAATGPEFSGCEEIEGSGELGLEEVDCSKSTHGCCPDGIKIAVGPNFEGCDVINAENCTASYFGCCPDGVSPALGPRYEGCRMPCEDEKFGCCSDRITPAHGSNQAGCCLTTRYGCCPDNILPAQGPNLEGCGCQYSAYGCCPDNATAARGPDAEGCGCQYTKYGCCPNRYTPAAGPEFQGCPCYTYQFGCCPDGMNIAKGPYNQGCGCENTEFGCCLDNRTPAQGPNKEGCGCEASKFSCCPDGETEAQGEKFEGCNEVPVTPGKFCKQDKDRGSCRDFKVKWFFDMEYGGCSRFWYGGCEGNDNRFSNQEECKAKCVEPPGRDACFLPKIEGPCEGYYPYWYYDIDRKQCGQFIYGGCLGNNNRFDTREECQDLCVIPDTLDVCEQLKAEGPCRGNFSRWYYDQDLRMCQEFHYGGCHGNRNNFLTESECQQQCLQPGRSREQDLCLLPAASGECHNYTERWYYDSYHVRCTPFYYGGCDGNQNNFLTRQDCQRRCESGYNTPEPEEEFRTEWCFLHDDHGPCSDSIAKWFYDSRDGVCKQFLYGGCQGNKNKFSAREECEERCGTVQDACDLPRVVGPCSGSIVQWYYDRSADTCYEFDYGGCQGNANRFNDRQQCEEFCKVITGSTAAALIPDTLILTTHAPFGMDICSTLVDRGPCQEEHAAWYYDSDAGACQAFIYGGCGGNANRFESEEQCERHCGSFKGQDVCNVPYETGPCRGYFQKWYYNPTAGGCQEFVYGGCGGNGNRFSSLEECETICLHREELFPRGNDTTLSHQAVCQLPVDTGPCSGGYYKRWYFDEDRQTCIPFIYSGCAGNRNRFKNFQSCLNFCSVVLQEGYGQPGVTDVRPNEIDVGSGPVKPGENKCEAATLECHLLQCPYGVERFVDSDDCERCQCHDPCKKYSCPNETQCAVDLYHNLQTNETEFRGVCRPTNKPGQCPKFAVSDGNCVQECQSDADCTGDTKCCFSGCVSSCLNPVFAEHITTEAPHLLPPESYGIQGAEPPSFEETESKPQVRSEEGNYVTLRCVARGRPTPTISWRKGVAMIDGSGRYKLLLDGSLQIIGLYRKDSGIYICIADNGIGKPIQREFELEVTEPTSRPAEVIGEDKTYVVVTLGAPTILQCYAVGWPPPTVTWWRGDRMLPLSSEQFEQRRDYSLLIRSVTLRNLGPYTCQAYNGYGRAASWTVTVQAVGPVYSGDSKYNEYLVPAPKRPEIPETEAPTERPSYPYRPVRPPPQPQSRTRPPFVQPTSPPEISPHPEPELTPRVFIVPVQANVSLTRTVYPIGSDISIPCDVDGYPIPQVVWYKDEQLLEPSGRIHITENHRLLIMRANGSDAGAYRCSASNQYGHSSSSVSIAVEGVYIHPNCTDNPFFANCRLIVAGQYCTHKYYARFCCKSCTQAGQLPSYGPHLEKSGTGISKRK